MMLRISILLKMKRMAKMILWNRTNSSVAAAFFLLFFFFFCIYS
jgi:hypothetical protein